jgi:hypothetical protein
VGRFTREGAMANRELLEVAGWPQDNVNEAHLKVTADAGVAQERCQAALTGPSLYDPPK